MDILLGKDLCELTRGVRKFPWSLTDADDCFLEIIQRDPWIILWHITEEIHQRIPAHHLVRVGTEAVSC